MSTTQLPDRLREVVEDFAALPTDLRLQLLVEYADKVPALPQRYVDDHDQMEQVTECQAQFFLVAEVDDDGKVSMHFDCPPEAPTQRGFAGILREGLEGASAEDVLNVPQDFYHDMGLTDAVSLLRLRGLDAILARLKRQIREQLA